MGWTLVSMRHASSVLCVLNGPLESPSPLAGSGTWEMEGFAYPDILKLDA